MWFAKWFGGNDDDYEPAEVSAQETRSARRHDPPAAKAERRSASKNKGFDPYNSGAFRQRQAWERINRR